MKYYLDTEFHEYHKQHRLLGISIGRPVPTIDLISIGIVSGGIEDNFSNELEFVPDPIFYNIPSERLNAQVRHNKGEQVKMVKNYLYKKQIISHREYYAISKDFNIKDAWNSWQKRLVGTVEDNKIEKQYWLRENVLKPIFTELWLKDNSVRHKSDFTYDNFKLVINKYGKTNKQIAEEIHAFVYKEYLKDTGLSYPEAFNYSNPKYDPKFYAYYADYDWVVFCQLFGKMIDLPEGFPMYCRDLQQELDETVSRKYQVLSKPVEKWDDYPKQENEHNALDDARWNKRLYEFIKKL